MIRSVMRALAYGLIALLSLGTLPAQAQASGPLYFPATGHTLTDDAGFLRFWQSHEGERLFGLPITEAINTANGLQQYFERGRLEQRTDAYGAPIVVAAPVAREYVAALFLAFPAAPPRPEQRQGVRYFRDAAYTLREPFLTFWEEHGATTLFGNPISEPIWEVTGAGRRQVQYFANARLERDPRMIGTPDEIVVSDLGRALAALLVFDTAAVENPGYDQAGPATTVADLATFSLQPTAAPEPTAEPAPLQPARAAAPVRTGGGKRIVVNLSDQWMYAYEGETQVYDAPVSTGRDGMETPTGTFAIYAKLSEQTMDGVLDGKYWVVPEVPNVMYIYGGVALHGTYWHNRFGTGARLSHGCVNLPLKAAAWLYQWAPVGTTVRVTY